MGQPTATLTQAATLGAAEIAKILLDSQAAATSTACAELCKEGHFSPQQIADMMILDTFYIAVTGRIATQPAVAAGGNRALDAVSEGGSLMEILEALT